MRKNLIVFSLLGTSLITPNLINYQQSNRENVRQMKVYRDMKKHYVNTKFYAEHTGYEYIPIYNFHYVNNFIKSYSALRNTMIKVIEKYQYQGYSNFLWRQFSKWKKESQVPIYAEELAKRFYHHIAPTYWTLI
ncbi:hypothetical protein [Spiroplasma endosymbiont of Lonchoptera lutea]|uniref:hypothetical protein n=1 Tax=Spiroplasma endosymbiont of Lonchoptera lutea TaxID=3066297 RepID=UPI0030D53D1C